MKKVGILAALLLATAGGAFWELRRRAVEKEAAACVLAGHAPLVGGWVAEASADPYLGVAALRGPTNSVFAAYRTQARWIAEVPSSWLLPEEAREAFVALSLAELNSEEMAGRLRRLPAIATILHCDPLPDSDRKDALGKLVRAGEVFWAERRAVAEVERREFARDRVIFCRSAALLERLRSVRDGAAASCGQAPPGSQLAKACAGGPVPGAVAAEISDLEKQKEFNMRKLRQKWPAGVIRGLEC
jgi:hypothetical protein